MLTFTDLEKCGKLRVIHSELRLKGNREINGLFMPYPYDFFLGGGEIVFVVETFSARRSNVFTTPQQFTLNVAKIVTSQGIAFAHKSWLESYSTEI